MSKLVFETDRFRCRLHCDRCTHIKANGQRCGNRVCFGTPICWIHTKQLFGLRIKSSSIAGAGKGLYATRYISAGSWICPYVGELISEQCLDLRYPGDITAPFTVNNGDGSNYIDSACKRGIGAIANGIFDNLGVSLPHQNHNAEIEFKPESQMNWLRATRNIFNGEEIFVYYGNVYRLENNHLTRRSKMEDTRPC